MKSEYDPNAETCLSLVALQCAIAHFTLRVKEDLAQKRWKLTDQQDINLARLGHAGFWANENFLGHTYELVKHLKLAYTTTIRKHPDRNWNQLRDYETDPDWKRNDQAWAVYRDCKHALKDTAFDLGLHLANWRPNKGRVHLIETIQTYQARFQRTVDACVRANEIGGTDHGIKWAEEKPMF